VRISIRSRRSITTPIPVGTQGRSGPPTSCKPGGPPTAGLHHGFQSVSVRVGRRIRGVGSGTADRGCAGRGWEPVAIPRARPAVTAHLTRLGAVAHPRAPLWASPASRLLAHSRSTGSMTNTGSQFGSARFQLNHGFAVCLRIGSARRSRCHSRAAGWYRRTAAALIGLSAVLHLSTRGSSHG
jgi:hypothetical protein